MREREGKGGGQDRMRAHWGQNINCHSWLERESKKLKQETVGERRSQNRNHELEREELLRAVPWWTECES